MKDHIYILFLGFFVFIHSALLGQFSQIQKITANHRVVTGVYGDNVEIVGDFAFVTHMNDNKNANGTNQQNYAGALYIYKKDALGAWSLHQKLVPNDRDANDQFGSYFDVFGNYLVVSASRDEGDSNNTNTLSSAGSAYVFKRGSNGYWSQIQKINASNRQVNDMFGLALSMDNNLLAISAPYHDYDINGNNFEKDAGAVYIYNKNAAGNYVQTQIITDIKRDTNERFGFYLSLSGNHLAVTSLFDNYDENDSNYMPESGALLMYELNPNGQFVFKEKLVSPYRQPDGLFGQDVQLLSSKMFIGASREDLDTVGQNFMDRAGAAYVYSYNGNNWALDQKIIEPDRDTFDFFGFSLAAFGNKLLIGAINNSYDTVGSNYKNASGAAYYFERNSSGKWVFKQKIIASDRDQSDLFGYNVGLWNFDAICGAVFEDHDVNGGNKISESGSAYIYSVCLPFYSYDTANLCYGDSILLGGQYRFNEGLYLDSFQTADGCDSNYYYYLDLDTLNPKIQPYQNSLFTSVNDAQYQWYDCNRDSMLAGDTLSYFTPSANGKYAVIVTKGLCVRMSDCFDYNYLSLPEDVLYESIKIYPNPAINEVIIDLRESTSDFRNVVISNLSGKVLHSGKIDGNSLLQVDVEKFPKGLYLIELIGNDLIHREKIIVQ